VELNVFIVLVLVFDIILNGFFFSFPTDGPDVETARPKSPFPYTFDLICLTFPRAKVVLSRQLQPILPASLHYLTDQVEKEASHFCVSS
jgi:hypothetical protein